MRKSQRHVSVYPWDARTTAASETTQPCLPANTLANRFPSQSTCTLGCCKRKKKLTWWGSLALTLTASSLTFRGIWLASICWRKVGLYKRSRKWAGLLDDLLVFHDFTPAVKWDCIAFCCSTDSTPFGTHLEHNLSETSAFKARTSLHYYIPS